MENEWTIKPRQGVGALLFGMTPDNVAALSTTYGQLGPATTDEHRRSTMEDTIAKFGEFLSEEDIATMRESLGAAGDSRTQSFLDDGPVLDFSADRLVGITISARKKAINFQDKLVFDMDAQELLALLEKANGAPGRYGGSTGAAFDSIAIYLDSFSSVRNGRVQPMPNKDKRFRERTIGLREKPYTTDEMLPDFTTHSFL